MNNQLSKLKSVKKEEGFTIIEVMIVLAIAGLILLIVFLAVPALQRNARNTAMKNDAASLSAAVSEFKGNNDGSLPAAITGSGTTSVTVGTNGPVAKVQANTTVTLTQSVTGTLASYTTAVNTILIATDSKCVSTSGTTTILSKGMTAIFYTVENGGTAQPRCVDV